MVAKYSGDIHRIRLDSGACPCCCGNASTMNGLLMPLPSSDTEVLSAADWTPGTCRIRSRISTWRRRVRSGSSESGLGIDIANVSSCSPCVKPGSTRFSAWKLRIIRPDATSRTSASAISATTSTLRVRCRSRLSLADRPPFLSAVTRGDAYFTTGIKPNRTPAATESSATNPRTAGWSAISLTRGNAAGAVARTIRIAAAARPTPTTPPASPMPMLSDRSVRASCPRVAPRAERTASSC